MREGEGGGWGVVYVPAVAICTRRRDRERWGQGERGQGVWGTQRSDRTQGGGRWSYPPFCRVMRSLPIIAMPDVNLKKNCNHVYRFS